MTTNKNDLISKYNQEQGICPVCGSENLEYSSMEIGDESVSYPWICNKCGSNGYEVYNLQFVEHDKVCVNSKKNREQKKNEIVEFFGLYTIFVVLAESLFILLMLILIG